MKNFKKLFGIVASMLMVLSLVPVNVLGATYSEELQASYDYGYEMGITTKSTIDSADMYGSLIRSHMAKMMSNYAVEVLGLTPDTSVDCSFSDMSNETAEMQDYAVEACQLGLMGLNNDGTPASMFNPTGTVTRAQFGTVLSRALYGDMYNGGEPRYGDHLNALQADGVMTNISNPNATEVRGYVMLMMMRADEYGVATNEGSICNDPITIALCAIGDSACPAECLIEEEEVEVKAGSIAMSLNSNTIANGSEIPMNGIVKFAIVDFAASSSDVSLKTVELEKLGLAAIPTTTRVWFEKNGVRVSGRASFTSEGVAIISFAPQYVVKANSTESLDLYVELSTTANQDFRFMSDTVDSTAMYTNGSFTTPTLRTANYTVASLTIAAASATGTANVTANGMELGAFIVANTVYTGSETRDVMFQSITLRQNGSASLSNLDNIILERNGVAVASNPTIDGRNLTFSIMDQINHATSATYYIKAIVNNVETSNDTYQFELRNTTDLNAVETKTSFRSSVAAVVSLYTYTINGGEMTFTRDTNYPLSANYAAGSDVILMKGTIKTNDAITVEDPTLFISSSSTLTTGLNDMFTTIYLQVGSSIFSYSPVATDTGAAFVGAATIDGTATVKIYGRLRDTAPARTVKFEDLMLSSFRLREYVSNGVTVTTSVGNIAGIAVSSQVATLNVTKTDALGATTLALGSSDVLVYGLRLSSTQGNGVTFSRVALDITGNNLTTTGYGNNAYLTLYIDGVAKSTKTVTTSNSVVFDGFSKSIAVGTPVDIQVKANFAEAFSVGNFQATLTTDGLNAYDTLTSTTITGYATPAGAVFTMGTAVGTLAASNNNPLATLLLSPSIDQQIIAFKMTASNDSIRLYDVDLTGTNLSNLSNFRLTTDEGTVIATATTATNTAVTFAEIASSPSIAKDTSANYYVIADVNTNTNVGPIVLTVDSANVNIKGSNGNTIAAAGSSVVSRSHAIAENVITVAKAANTNKSLTTSALRFTVTAAGTDSVLLTGVTLNNALAGYTGTIGVRIYKSSINSANLAGSGVHVNGTATIFAMTQNSNANSTVDAGSTVEYIVALQGALIDPASSSQDWNVSLTDIYFGGITASTYNNIGELPMTEVK